MNRNHFIAYLFIVMTFLGFFALAPGCKKDEGGNNPPPGPTPITDDLFPLAAYRQFDYWGFLVQKNTVDSAVLGTSLIYHTTWTLLPGPAGTWLIKDSTNITGLTNTTTYLQIKKATNGDFSFRQTLGPFYRAFGVSYTDTLIWVELVKPSVGVNAVWTAFDTTVTGQVSSQTVPVHLQIFGKIYGFVSITDSTASHTQHNAYYVRTWRKITIGTQVAQDDATTAKLWLVKDIGPVQVNIAGDTENYGHFRVMKNKNF